MTCYDKQLHVIFRLYTMCRINNTLLVWRHNLNKMYIHFISQCFIQLTIHLKYESRLQLISGSCTYTAPSQDLSK